MSEHIIISSSANPATSSQEALRAIPDPVSFAREVWPSVRFYSEQEAILRSLVENDETFCVAGNMLGKDFVAGYAVLYFFLTRSPCRVITTSVKDDHLRVLWGEIGRYIQTSKYPLDSRFGGPLVINHRDIKKKIGGVECPLSYLRGMVSEKGEGLAGHHIAYTSDRIPRTLFVVDEASGVDNEAYERSDTWANRKLVIGNPYPCDNFFRHAVEGKPGSKDKGGDIPRSLGSGYYRKVIKIRAQDSPNVRYAEAEIRAGRTPTGSIILEGVKSYQEYRKNRELWDIVRQTISLDANFYKGADVLLYPPEWLNRAERIADSLRGRNRKAEAIGIDPAEGGDKTAMCAVDRYGIIELVSRKTPDTSMITSEALAFARKHGCPPDRVVFDRGGGGKQHADRLRNMGFRVRTVAFGESLIPEPKRGTTPLAERKDNVEDRYAYRNRRAEMFGELRLLLDPSVGIISLLPDYDPNRGNIEGFGIPSEYGELRKQLSVFPLLYDPEGRMELPPKNKRNPEDKKVTLIELIGHSPDEADALVLAIHGMLHASKKPRVGAFA